MKNINHNKQPNDQHSLSPKADNFSNELQRLLSKTTYGVYDEAIRYTELSQAEKSCVDCFLREIHNDEKQEQRTARNHRRLDIGAWIMMSKLPLHPSITQIVDNIQEKIPNLLTQEERTMLEKMFTLHIYIRHDDASGYEAYICSLPEEEQSSTIQAYKQMIIALTVHPNGRSSYFPYLPTETTIHPETYTNLEDYNTFPWFEKYSKQLLQNKTHLHLPQTPLQELFHDLLLLSSLAQQCCNPEAFTQLLALWSNISVGVINNEPYTADMFFPKPQDTTTNQQSKTVKTDQYVQNTYTILQSMHTATRSLLTDRAYLHREKSTSGTYSTASNQTLTRIRETIQSISVLHGRIDCHYFIRHLPSTSDVANKHISDAVEDIDISHDFEEIISTLPCIVEKQMLLYSSERKYALTSAALVSSYRKNTYGIDINAQTYDGLNNHSKEEFILPLNNIPNEKSMLLLIDYISIIPTSTVHITHGRVLKRIRDFYGLENRGGVVSPGKVYLIPFYQGVYNEKSIHPEPTQRITLLEQIRITIHQYAIKYGKKLDGYKKEFSSTQTQQISPTDFCYWIVDFLRILYHENKNIYKVCTDGLLQKTRGSSETLTLFFSEKDPIITTNERTE